MFSVCLVCLVCLCVHVCVCLYSCVKLLPRGFKHGTTKPTKQMTLLVLILVVVVKQPYNKDYDTKLSFLFAHEESISGHPPPQCPPRVCHVKNIIYEMISKKKIGHGYGQ